MEFSVYVDECGSCESGSEMSMMKVEERVVTLPFGAMMNELRQENKLVDTKILCDQKQFGAHRIVLAANSPFFESLLLDDSEKNATTTLDLEDVSPEVMAVLLDYMYEGQQPQPTLSLTDNDAVLNLLTTAHLLEIAGAPLYYTQALLESGSNLTDVASIWDWGDLFRHKEVVETVVAYLATDFCAFSLTNDFRDLSQDRLTSLLSHPSLATFADQDSVMQAVSTWAQYDPPNRENLVPSLLEAVDFIKRGNNVTRPKFPREETSSLQRGGFKSKSMTSVGDRSSGNQKSAFKVTKLGKKKVEVEVEVEPIVASLEFEKVDDCEPTTEKSYSRGTDKLGEWEEMQSSADQYEPTRSSTMGEEMKAGELMLVGGRDGANRSVIHYFNPAKREWIGCLEVPVEAHVGERMVAVDTNVFVVGGEDARTHPLSAVHEFDPRNRVFRTLPPLHVPRTEPSVASLGNSLFVVGGVSRFKFPMTHVEYMDVSSGIWKILPPVKADRTDPGITVANSTVYVIGGHTSKCEMFDFFMRTRWQPVAPLPDIYRDEPIRATTADNSRILAFRRHRPERFCCLDLDSNKTRWQVVKANGKPPNDMVALAVYNKQAWALDACGRLMTFDLRNLQWTGEYVTPKSLLRPMHMVFVDQ